MFSLTIRFGYFSILLIKSRTFNTSIGSSLNFFSSLLQHFRQIIERTNVFCKIFYILEILNVSYLPKATQ